MPLTFPRLLLLSCLPFLALGGSCLAERKPAAPVVGVAPPQPMEMNVKIRREGKTEIPFRIYGRANEPLKYLIRVPPVNGKISDPQSKEREVSVAVYEPPADLSVTTDKFSYAVQSSAGVSAAVEVNITIIDRPPQLAIQDNIDFGTIRAGAKNFRMLEISNKGGLIASGEVVVDPPWKIDGKTAYHLKADDVAVFKVLFTPDSGGKFEGVARFTSDPQHSTTLRGVAEAAIAANPPQWVLQQAPGDSSRTGTFELLNQLDEARTIQLKADARLKVTPQLTIPAHSGANVTVEAPSDTADAFDAAIQLTAPDFSISIPVRVPALSAVMRATPQAIAFGRLPLEAKAKENFEVENIGGASGRVTWEIAAPFSTSETSVTLQAGEKKEFVVELETKIPGHYRTWLKFRSGTQTFDIPVEAEVAAAGNAMRRPAAGPVVAGAPRGESGVANADGASETTEPAPAPPQLAPLPDWVTDPRLPEGVRVLRTSSTSVVIEWPANLTPSTTFRVDMRQLATGPDGRLEISWLRPTGIPIDKHGDRYQATLTDLMPGQPWSVRILPILPSGEAGAPLFTADFSTPSKSSLASHMGRPSLLQLLVLALIFLIGRQVWQRWRRRN